MMIRTAETEVKRLYDLYGIKNDGIQIKTVLNRGDLGKKLNCDFSNVFGKTISNNYSSNSTNAPIR